MIDDGLYQPLGRPGPSDARRPSRSAWPVVFVLGIVGLGAAGSWVLFHREVRETPVAASEPQQAIPPAPAPAAVEAAKPPAPPAPPAPPPTLPKPSTLSGTEAEAQSGVTVVRPPGTTAGPGTFVAVPQADTVALAPAPDPRLVEKGRYGPLPRRGADGATPAEVYGRPVTPDPALPANTPRVAIFVGGMGLNRGLTAEAARALPPAISLGFAPYGGDLEQQVAQARELGHEAILQVPMESFNAPDGTAMPHMLTVVDSPRDTLDNLHWQMSRFVGYAGVSSFLGGKFTGDATALTPVLKDIAARGLFYFDDGTAARSLARSLGPEVGLPTVRADVAIDALADPAQVDAALKKLEALARSKGMAVGATTGLPTVVDRLAAFTRALASRGVALVPLSSLAANAEQAAKP